MLKKGFLFFFVFVFVFLFVFISPYKHHKVTSFVLRQKSHYKGTNVYILKQNALQLLEQHRKLFIS